LVSARNVSVAFNILELNTMHKPLNIAERAELQLAEKVKLPMTRREKLMRLADIARGGRNTLLTKGLKLIGWDKYYENTWHIFHLLEHMIAEQLAQQVNVASVFDAAAKDPVLYDGGLRPDQGESVSALRAMQFFELKQNELHAFSCNCGGAISNAEMASRIEKMAG
jgi:hypothetical protein